MPMTTIWLAPEKAKLERMYLAGVPVRDIAKEIGRTEDAIRRAVGRWKLHRPVEHKSVDVRLNLAWPRIRAVLEQSHGMTIPDICKACGMFKSVVLNALAEHRDELDIVRWKPTTRRPMAIWKLGSGLTAVKPIRVRRSAKSKANPFLVAMGEIAAPKGGSGRVYRQSMDITDDELEAA